MSSPSEAATTESFSLEDVEGEWSTRFGPVDPDEIHRLIDPASALRTVDWGRSYLYEAQLRTSQGPRRVVVKAFPGGGGWRERRSRARKGTKARRSWRAALAFRAADVSIPEPVFMADSRQPDGPGFFVCELVEDALEARYLFRSMNARREREAFPGVDVAAFVRALGQEIRRLHDRDCWHRDVSAGNVLLDADWQAGRVGRLYLLDLNRARVERRLSRNERMRDLARLPLFRRQHRELLLEAYFGGPPPAPDRLRYRLAHFGFHTRHRVKDRLRGVRSFLRGFRSRGAHGHIPPPAAGSSLRDRVVWDPLSDQPHLHAGRAAKAWARLHDAGAHARGAGVLLGSLPRTWTAYREIRASLYREPVRWGELGVGLRSGTAPDEELVGLVEASGAMCVLLRLHPWEGGLDADEALARRLRERGFDLTLAVPQNRDLVRDPAAWREVLVEVRERFFGLVSCIQIGHAINRSKWGIWNPSEYRRLLETAREVFVGAPGAPELAGPAVIDFEFHQTAIALGWPRRPVRFDVVSSLLYVDRRGAPENRQAGFDTIGKIALLAAVVRASPEGDRPLWITEVNWPLREGPHSPAGRHVAVDEERQADYLVRYALLVLGTGLVERVYWWQLVARGYGLVDPTGTGLRSRPALDAMRNLLAFSRGGWSLGPLPSEDPIRLHGLERADGSRWVVAWTRDDSHRELVVAGEVLACVGRDGEPFPLQAPLPVSGAPVYLQVRPEEWSLWSSPADQS